jgi:hypothetical protein
MTRGRVAPQYRDRTGRIDRSRTTNREARRVRWDPPGMPGHGPEVSEWAMRARSSFQPMPLDAALTTRTRVSTRDRAFIWVAGAIATVAGVLGVVAVLTGI